MDTVTLEADRRIGWRSIWGYGLGACLQHEPTEAHLGCHITFRLRYVDRIMRIGPDRILL